MFPIFEIMCSDQSSKYVFYFESKWPFTLKGCVAELNKSEGITSSPWSLKPDFTTHSNRIDAETHVYITDEKFNLSRKEQWII